VLGTNLASGVVNPGAAIGIVGPNMDGYMERAMGFMTGTLDGPATDIDDPNYWAIAPEVIAAEVIHAIDQPWGVTISDVTVRATGEDYVI
jgi:hypothetical protein